MKKRRVRKELKKDRIIVLILSFLLLIFGIYYFTSNKNDKVLDNTKVEKEEKIKEYSINLIMGGDALIHDKLYNACKTDNGYDFKPVFTYLKEY